MYQCLMWSEALQIQPDLGSYKVYMASNCLAPAVAADWQLVTVDETMKDETMGQRVMEKLEGG